MKIFYLLLHSITCCITIVVIDQELGLLEGYVVEVVLHDGGRLFLEPDDTGKVAIDTTAYQIDSLFIRTMAERRYHQIDYSVGIDTVFLKSTLGLSTVNITGKKTENKSVNFHTENKKSAWFWVSFGSIGTSLPPSQELNNIRVSGIRVKIEQPGLFKKRVWKSTGERIELGILKLHSFTPTKCRSETLVSGVTTINQENTGWVHLDIDPIYIEDFTDIGLYIRKVSGKFCVALAPPISPGYRSISYEQNSDNIWRGGENPVRIPVFELIYSKVE